jgi:hypothetical protein
LLRDLAFAGLAVKLRRRTAAMLERDSVQPNVRRKLQGERNDAFLSKASSSKAV